jgi:hypothetical protein
MVPLMKESSISIKSKAMATIFGPMEGNTKVYGRTTKCMEKASSHGLMAESMKANIYLIKKKVEESSHGPMDDHIKVSGKMENNKVKAFIDPKTEFSDKVFGRTEKKFVGLEIQRVKRETEFM